MTSASYIYLLQDGEYIGTSIYKVGRTTQNGDTRSLHSTNTVQVYLREVNTEKVIEIKNDVIKVFTIK
jgi:hypothetical protein